MKKLFYLLLLVLPFALTSCHDDGDDLPRVDFDVTFDGAVSDDNGVLYVVQGETFSVEGIKVINLEEGKGAFISSASYFWDGYPLGTSVVDPYGMEISTSNTTPLGNHSLQISCPLYATDKPAAQAVIGFTVKVVGSADDIPGNADATVRRITPSISE